VHSPLKYHPETIEATALTQEATIGSKSINIKFGGIWKLFLEAARAVTGMEIPSTCLLQFPADNHSAGSTA